MNYKELILMTSFIALAASGVVNPAFADTTSVASKEYVDRVVHNYSAGNGLSLSGDTFSVLIGNGLSVNPNTKAIGLAGDGFVQYGTRSGSNAEPIGEYATASDSGVAVGVGSNANDYSVAIGYQTTTVSTNAIAIGRTAKSGNMSIGIGVDANAGGGSSIALGGLAKTTTTGGVAIGYNAGTNSDNCIAIGKNAKANVSYGIAIGEGVTVNANSAIAIGVSSTATGYQSVAIGAESKTTEDGSVAVGRNASSVYYGAAFGPDSDSDAQSVAIGYRAKATGSNTVAVGVGSNANDQGVAVGATASAKTGGVAIGLVSDAGNYGVAMGYTSDAAGTESIAIGRSSVASTSGGVAIGTNASVGSNYGVAMGSGAKVTAEGGVAIGYSAGAGYLGVAFGQDSSSDGQSVAIGYLAKTSEPNNVAIGAYSNAAGQSVAIGYSAQSTYNAVAIGPRSNAGIDSIALMGNATGENGVAIKGNVTSLWGIAIGGGVVAGSYGMAFGVGANAAKEKVVAVGYGAKVSASYGVAIGADAMVTTNDGGIAIGYGANSNGGIQIGNSSITYADGDVRFGNRAAQMVATSDERDKIDLKPVSRALEFLTKLDVYDYWLNERIKYQSDTNDAKIIAARATGALAGYDKDAWKNAKKKDPRRKVGVKAQQVEKVIKQVYGTDNYGDLVNDNFRGKKIPSGGESQLTVNYDAFVPFLIQAVKDQQIEIQELRQELKNMKTIYETHYEKVGK